MRAAPWVSVSRVIVYIAGKPVKRWEIPTHSRSSASTTRTISTSRNDTYVLVRVEGDKSLSPVVGGGKDVTVPRSR